MLHRDPMQVVPRCVRGAFPVRFLLSFTYYLWLWIFTCRSERESSPVDYTLFWTLESFAWILGIAKMDLYLVNYILFWPWNCQNGFKPCKLHIILALELFNMESYISPCKTHTFLAWSCMESARIGSYAVNYILFWPRNEFCPVNYITYWTHWYPVNYILCWLWHCEHETL